MTNISEKLYCSPGSSHNAFQDGTCFSLQDLQTLAREYNTTFPDKKIRITNNKTDLIAKLTHAFKDKCKNNQYCWLNQPPITKKTREELDHVFRTPKPLTWYKDPKTWLNTLDILHTLRQYEKLHKNFTFLGVHPIDFSENNSSGYCIGDTLCTFGMKDLRKDNKIKFALVLNTDPSDKSGQHWFSVYGCIDPQNVNFGIYCYDSVANSPPKEVVTFMNKFKQDIYLNFPGNIAKKFVVKHNKIQSQFEDFDCGTYSIVFVTQMLKDEPFDRICRLMKRDDEINKLRDILFRPAAGGGIRRIRSKKKIKRD